MVYIDTNIFIYLFEGHDIFAKQVAEYIEECRSLNRKISTSTLTITELMAGNLAVNSDIFDQIIGLELKSVDLGVAKLAGKLQNENKKLYIGDSIHLASAISSGCNIFYTNDKALIDIANSYITTVVSLT